MLLSLYSRKARLELGNLLSLPVKTFLTESLLLSLLSDLGLGSSSLGPELEHVGAAAFLIYTGEDAG